MSDSQYVEALLDGSATIETRFGRVLVNEVKRLRAREEVLAAEAERLLNGAVRLRAQHTDAQKSVDELLATRNALIEKVGRLEAENTRLLEQLEVADAGAELATKKLEALKAANAEWESQYGGLATNAVNDVDYWRLKGRDHWDAYQGLAAEVEPLKARLAWFEEREPWVRKHVDHCWFENGEAVQDWEAENPKPSEGT